MRATARVCVWISVSLASACSGANTPSPARNDVPSGITARAPVEATLTAAALGIDRCYVLWTNLESGGAGNPPIETSWLIDLPAAAWIAGTTISSGTPDVTVFLVYRTHDGALATAEEIAVANSASFDVSTLSLLPGSLVTVTLANPFDILHYDLDPNGTGTAGPTSISAGTVNGGSFVGTWSPLGATAPADFTPGSGTIATIIGVTNVSIGTTVSVAQCYSVL